MIYRPQTSTETRSRRGPRPGKTQRRTAPAQGRNHTLYVFDADWQLIEDLSTELGWTYGRVHGWLMRLFLASNRRSASSVSTLAAHLRDLEAGEDDAPATPDHD